MKKILLPLAALLATSVPAWAQNYGQDWLDEISREMQAEKGPLDPNAMTTKTWVGGSIAYDDNVFLEGTNENSDTPLTGIIRVRGDYAEKLWDVTFDGILSWTEYFKDATENASDHQERVLGRIRYAGPVLDIQLADIFRNESDPTDVVLNDKIERLVNDTRLNGIVRITPTLGVHADGTFQIVKFHDSPWDTGDNWNVRSHGGLTYSMSTEIDIVAEAGLFHLHPRTASGAGETDGYFARGGVRGSLTPTLHLTLLGGVTSAESEASATVPVQDEDTFDAAVHLKWEATELVTLHADYRRLITYTIGMGGDPFQTIDRVAAIGEFQATQYIGLRGRAQYDNAESALGVERDYLSLGGRVIITPNEGIAISVDFTWRTGEISGQFDYDNTIISAGLLLFN